MAKRANTTIQSSKALSEICPHSGLQRAGRINTYLCAEEAHPSLESETLFTLDFVCLVGEAAAQIGEITAAMAGVRVVEAPREIKSFPYFMTWHPRLTNEPAHEWFREQLRSAVRTV